MASNYSRTAKFDNVKYDEEALRYHAEKYEAGIRSPLTLACYTYLLQRKKMEEQNEIKK
jgi:hypothetical protein